MKNIVLHRSNVSKARLFAGIVAFFAFVICSINVVQAIQYNAITLSGTTGNVEVKSNKISNLTITPALVFNNTGDSVTYKITLKNPDRTEFRINDISDDNTNSYISTSYQYDKALDATEKPVYITLSYSSYISFGDDLDLDDIHILIDIYEKEKQEGGAQDIRNTQNIQESQGTQSPMAAAPNTGADGAKFLSLSSSDSSNILPQIIVIVISIAILLIVIPTQKKHRISFSVIGVVALTSTLSFGMTNVDAKGAKLELTIAGSDISAMPDAANPQEVVSITFPNIYNNKVQDRDGQAPGNTIILKTLDDKYVMMDTGPSTASIREVIYDTLKNLQSNDHVVIDYLILSHLDSDHYGNAEAIMSDENYTIKNILYKHERYDNGSNSKEEVFQSITQTAVEHNVSITTSGDAATREYLATLGVTDYNQLSEGMAVEIGKYLTLDIFNTANVFDDKSCQSGQGLYWSASTTMADDKYIKSTNGEYVYFDGSEYQTKTNNDWSLSSSKYPYSEVAFHTTPTLITKEGGDGMNRYFYAYTPKNHNICVSNPNAFGILAEVTTANLKRYMYFPGDIENAGYGTLSSGANSSQVFNNLVFDNGEFTTNITPYAIPSEDNTATAIYNKLADDADASGLPIDTLLDNIVIYQESHHGGNNSEKAIQKLNLNRSSGIYAIQEGTTNMPTTANFNQTKTYHYTLGRLPAEKKLRVGTNTQDGISCTINVIGATSCIPY